MSVTAAPRCCQHIKLLYLTAEKLCSQSLSTQTKSSNYFNELQVIFCSESQQKNKSWVGGLEMGSLCRIVLFFFFFVMQIYLESFFVWLKETNLQINHLSRLSAARSDRYQTELGNMTVAVLRRWQKMCCSLTGLQRFPDVHVQQLLPPAYARMSKMT